jgi:GWxTD domain-containing protein
MQASLSTMSRELGRWRWGLAGWLVAVPLLAGPPANRGPSDLTNFQLSPENSQWLVGPISWMAQPKEIEGYLALTDDETAERFITEFWTHRTNPSSPWPTEQPRAVFERRAQEADHRFSEGARLGRRTDRGTVFVLYGEPEKITFEVPDHQPPQRQRTLEVWNYAKDAPVGLDGNKPKRKYFFTQRDGLTVFNTPP